MKADVETRLAEIADRALAGLMSSDEVPQGTTSVTDSAIHALMELLQVYMRGGTALAAKLDTFVEAFFQDDDEVVRAMDVPTQATVRGTLSLLRRMKGGHVEGKAGGAASDGTGRTANPVPEVS